MALLLPLVFFAGRMERRREQRDLHGVCAALLEAPSPDCLHLELAEPVAQVPRLMAWWAWFVHVSVMHGPANASQVWLQAPPAPSTVHRALAFPSCRCAARLPYIQLS